MFTDIDCSRVTPADAVGMLLDVRSEIARLQAVQAELLVTAAGLVPQIEEFLVLVPMSDQERSIRIEDGVREELAAALRETPSTMQALIDTARTLVTVVPEVLAALKAGEITLAHARHLADAAERLPTDKVQEFVRLVLPTAKASTPTRTKAKANAVIARIDREGQERRRREAKCTRDVWVSPDVDGMSLLVARMTTEQAHALKVQIDADAFDRAFSIDAKAGLMMGEHRVEALAALVLGGKGTGSAPMRAHLNLTIDLPTLLGLRDQLVDGSAELAGEGPIPATVIRELLEDPHCAVTIRRLVKDPVTGHLLDYGRKTYEIPQPLRDYIVARDRTCRFPGCNRRADLCQLDHAIAWDDGGETNPQNLGALCTRHHQLKTHGGWEITESRPDGSCIWKSPEGRYYDTRGDGSFGTGFGTAPP